ncbi:MAG: SGNH/GDSL hydrolase family protein [Planctomycetales bacterium]|nr:SGNH/GDSL hydrolase family protein [Planctomycetales bacterium]
MLCSPFARSVLLAACALSAPALLTAQDATKAAKTTWIEVSELTMEGKAFAETASPYDRLPAAAEKVVRAPVWSLSRDSTGICARFMTDATEILAEWTLNSSRLEMPHMPATGVSGLDLYVRDDEGGWRWLGVGQPREQTNRATLASGIRPREDGKPREYLVYLPLYNGVKSVRIGVASDRQFTAAPARPAGREKPIVFYGTSITQGGCASRPGMVHTAILGRWFDRPVVNLGFSGNGRMETEVGQYMRDIDAAVFVIDCLPNITADQVSERTQPLIRQIRERHPETPILLVEDRDYSNSYLIDSKLKRNRSSQAALRKEFEALASTDKNLHYLRGPQLLGDDFEGTVDSSHPTDLGFWRQAKEFQTALKPLLEAH